MQGHLAHVKRMEKEDSGEGWVDGFCGGSVGCGDDVGNAQGSARAHDGDVGHD